MHVLLIRHALPLRVENAEGPADPSLSPEGVAQAEALARWLATEPIDHIYVSPMQRARDTAAPLERMLGIEATVVDEISEFDRHHNEYVPIEELRAANDPRWQQMVNGGYFDEVDVSPDEFRRTVVESIDAMIADNPGRTVAAVCHGGVINAWFSHLLGLESFMFFEPTYTSINRCQASRTGHRTLTSLNETAHLRS